MGETWYLANDMQFHWLAPFMLIPLALSFKKRYLIDKSTAFLGISICLVFITISLLTRAFILSSGPRMEYGVSSYDMCFYYFSMQF